MLLPRRQIQFLLAASLCLAAVLVGQTAQAEAVRGLPTGEESPFAVERVFTSPQGELQLIKNKEGRSAMFRSPSGDTRRLTGIRGPAVCDAWISTGMASPGPNDCQFTFSVGGEEVVIESQDLEESNLFQVVRSTLGSGKYVAL